jgi:hypothetical protein
LRRCCRAVALKLWTCPCGSRRAGYGRSCEKSSSASSRG